MLNEHEVVLLRKATSTGELRALDDLYVFFGEALDRWQKFHGSLPPNWNWIRGWIKIAAEFNMPEQAVRIVSGCPQGRRADVAKAYLAWNRNEHTRDVPNPYESLIFFLHHGGTWSRPENGILDISDALGQKWGIPATRHR